MQITDSKKWGIGSASLILSIFGAMFSFTSWNEKTLGEHFFDLIGISLPVGVISLIILFISGFVKHFFKFFSNIFELRSCCRFVDDLDTLSYLLSFVNCEFHFSEILFNCLFFKNNYLRQLSYNTTGSYACQP